MIKPKRMRWEWYVGCMGVKRECIQESGGKARRKESTKKNEM
jgi:hypothetical protein